MVPLLERVVVSKPLHSALAMQIVKARNMLGLWIEI